MAKKRIRNESDSKIMSLDFLIGDRYNAEEEKGKNTIGRQIEIAREELASPALICDISLELMELIFTVTLYGVGKLVRRLPHAIN